MYDTAAVLQQQRKLSRLKIGCEDSKQLIFGMVYTYNLKVQWINRPQERSIAFSTEQCIDIHTPSS